MQPSGSGSYQAKVLIERAPVLIRIASGATFFHFLAAAIFGFALDLLRKNKRPDGRWELDADQRDPEPEITAF